MYTHTTVPCRLDLGELHTQKQSHLNQHISAVKQQKEVSCVTTYSDHLLWFDLDHNRSLTFSSEDTSMTKHPLNIYIITITF